MNDKIAEFVIDNGSWLIKAGSASFAKPTAETYSVVGYPKMTTNVKTVYSGDEALSKRSVLNLTFPIDSGGITDWSAAEELWSHVFNKELHQSPKDCTVLIATSPLTPKADRAKIAQIMLTKFSASAVAVVDAQVLSLVGSGSRNGIVLDIGESSCYAVPIIDGKAISGAVKTLNLAGRSLTEYLMKILTERGYSFTTTAEREIVQNIKEQLCYVAPDFEPEMATSAASLALEKSYELPDGQVITIGNERFRCPEALFQPSFVGMEDEGIHHLIHQAITKCDAAFQSHMWGNIIISGGGSQFAGISQRLAKELKELAPANVKINIATPDANSRISAWIGGRN